MSIRRLRRALPRWPWPLRVGFTETVQALLDEGASVSPRIKGGWTILMLAAQNGHTSTVEVLVDAGADVNDVNDDGWTALMLAAQNGHVQTVSTLLARGADPSLQAMTGSTALTAGGPTRTDGGGSSPA